MDVKKTYNIKMKLPPFSSLQSSAHRFLYEHDLKELHNPDINSFEFQRYKVRIEKIIKSILKYVPEKGIVAEIGCAQGNISLLLAEKGYKAFGVDLRHSFLTYMMMKYERGELYPIGGNAENLPFKDNSFDAVILAELLEHVIYPQKIIAEAKRILKKEGIMIITTPNGEYIRNSLPSYQKFIPQKVQAQFLPDANGHLFAFRLKELKDLISKSGFRILEARTMMTPFITGYLYFRKLVHFFPYRFRIIADKLFTYMPFSKKFTSALFLVAEKI